MVPTHPVKSWKITTGFFPCIFQALKNPGKSVWSWKVPGIKAYGPGKYWRMKILDS